MASNDLTQIQQGLTAYIGAAQAAVPFEGRAKNQIVAGLLADELLKVSQVELNTPCDPYILVPLFKANIIFLKQQQHVLSQGNIQEETKQRILQYQAMIEVFEKLIKENTPTTKDKANNV